MKSLSRARSRSAEIKLEIEAIRRFSTDMIKRNEARDFLIKGGFSTPTGELPKRYGAWESGAYAKKNSASQPTDKKP